MKIKTLSSKESMVKYILFILQTKLHQSFLDYIITNKNLSAKGSTEEICQIETLIDTLSYMSLL